jgi:hypothetical protein
MMARVREMANLSSEPAALVDLILHGCLVESTRTEPGFDHRAAEPGTTTDSASHAPRHTP